MTLDTRILYKTTRYTDCSRKVIREFGKQVLIELGENSEGVMLPGKFGKMQLCLVKMDGYTRKGKALFQNYHSDGYVGIVTHFSRHQGYIVKHKAAIANMDHYRFRAFTRTKKIIKNIMHTDKWLDHLKFSTFSEYFSCLRRNKC